MLPGWVYCPSPSPHPRTKNELRYRGYVEARYNVQSCRGKSMWIWKGWTQGRWSSFWQEDINQLQYDIQHQDQCVQGKNCKRSVYNRQNFQSSSPAKKAPNKQDRFTLMSQNSLMKDNLIKKTTMRNLKDAQIKMRDCPLALLEFWKKRSGWMRSVKAHM